MRRPAAPALATLCVIGAVIGVVVWAMDPALLLSNTTTTGGDTGAHFALAAFLKSTLIPSGHVTGWNPGAYDGFPLNTFYFPLPDTLAALLGYIIPFDIAFKLVTILGSVTLPVAAWAFGRLAGMERPRPAALAAATLPFLFDQTFTIYGGNLYSTLAGEYAFSLGLSVALVFLGCVIRGLRTGRMRVPASLLLAACVLCHLVTGLFALAGIVVALVVLGPSWRRLWWVVTVVGTGFLLCAWWAVPFVVEQAYSTSMGWQNVHTFVALLAPSADRWVLGAGAVGLVLALVRRQRAMLIVTTLGVGSGIALVVDPQGKLYNTRFLPLWWICAYLAAGYALAELGGILATYVRRIQVQYSLVGDQHWMRHPQPGPAQAFSSRAVSFAAPMAGAITPAFHAVTDTVAGPRPGLPPVGDGGAGYGGAGPPPPWPPGGRRMRTRTPWVAGAVAVPILALAAASAVVLPPLLVGPNGATLGPIHIGPSNVAAWAQWNFSGYESKPAWPELRTGIVGTMDQVTKTHGCGRAMWEYNSDLNRFGTPMALMLLPYFTGGCVDSMEGLLFESSATTPWHFLNQSELSQAPSDAMNGLNYTALNVPLGIEHLQMLGVRYFLASSPVVQAQADVNPNLTPVASTGPWRSPYEGQMLATTWKIYLVHDASIVSPLTLRPDVLTGVGPGQPSWLPVAQRWYLDPARWSQEMVAGGLPSWTKAPQGEAPPTHTTVPPVHVSDVRVTNDQVGFHVDRTGVPVLVRVSYFPAWHASGALGPWRAEPNLMVVMPTSHDVTVTYGSTHAGELGLGLSVLGVLVVIVLIRRRRAYA